MLKEITIENFKCFGHKVTIPLGPLTLIYGENSAGKSAILQALRLLHNSMLTSNESKHAPIFSHRIVSTGNTRMDTNNVSNIPYSQVVHNGDMTKHISLGINLKYSDSRQVDLRAQYATIRNNVSKVNNYDQQGYLQHIFSQHDKIIVTPMPGKGMEKYSAKVTLSCFDDWLGVLYSFLCRHRSDILNSYNRLIELLVMQDFYKNNPSIHPQIGKSASRGVDFADGAIANLSDVRYDSHDARSKYNDGLEEWILFGIPGWVEYRESQQYVQRRQAYEIVFAEDILYFQKDPTYEEHLKRYANDVIEMESNEQTKRGNFSLSSLPRIVRDISLAAEPVIDLDVTAYYLGTPEAKVSAEGYEFRLIKYHIVKEIGLNVSVLSNASVNELMQDLRAKCAKLLQDHLSNEVALHNRFISLPPLREAPQEHYEDDTHLGWLANHIATRRAVNRWLVHLGTHYNVEYEDSVSGYGKTPYLIDVRIDESHPIQISESGFGFSQVLPIVIECLKNDSKIIMIEEPELHIHPKLQANLGDLFCDAVKKRQHQLMIETHSEHLMLRIQRLIRKDMMKSDDVMVLYISRNSNGSSVQRLRLDCDGEFMDEWPGGFFEESFHEIFGDSQC